MSGPDGEPGDPDADRARGDDRDVVDALVALGMEEADARVAVEEDRVPLVLVKTLLGEPQPYTLEELAELGGIDADALRQVFRALGLPLRERYGDGDLAEARQLAELLEVFSLETLVRLARVRGTSVSRIAMGDLNAVRDELLSPLREAGSDDLTIAVALAEAGDSLLPVASDLLVHAYRRALIHAMSSAVVSAAAREPGQELHLVVGFVDLVGYTALSARVDPAGLDQVLDDFEQRVLDVVGTTDRVTLVKFLGDAAMFVATEASPIADVLLRLVEPVEELRDAPMRAGMARGPTLVREGDYFGPAVNRAARLTDRSRPWSVLADADMDEDLGGSFTTTRIRPIHVRDVGLTRPIAVSRPEDA